jgi:hypothetical protein
MQFLEMEWLESNERCSSTTCLKSSSDGKTSIIWKEYQIGRLQDIWEEHKAIIIIATCKFGGVLAYKGLF